MWGFWYINICFGSLRKTSVRIAESETLFKNKIKQDKNIKWKWSYWWLDYGNFEIPVPCSIQVIFLIHFSVATKEPAIDLQICLIQRNVDISYFWI
jgi:hypothetical protein